MRNLFLLIVFVVSFPFVGLGQDTARVEVRTRVQPEAVLLRWAVSRPVAWKQMNRYGFRLERYTVARDGKLLDLPEKKVLCDTPVRPRPLEEWKSLAERDNNAAIIAQALFGDDFLLAGEEAEGIARVIAMSQELEQRFSFSLFAADRSFEAACMAGWGWRDTLVNSGECYLYRILPLLPPNVKIDVEQGSAYVCMDEHEELPCPVGLAAVWGDGGVMLAWDYSMLADVYNAYYIEKSSDSSHFSRLSGSPLINSQDKRRMVYMDSLADNTARYYYRVRGITPFGEIGPASEVISGKGKRTLPYVPNITRSEINEDGVLELRWEFDERGNELIDGFRLNRADKAAGPYKEVVAHLTPERRHLLYGELAASDYFTISALPKEGEPRTSYPVLVQRQDTTPPAPPADLTGKIDSAGIVRLHWKANREADILGYKIFRALRREDADREALPLFDDALRDTVYCDTVDVYNLNPKVYYYLKAVDQRYNQSDPTALLELEKPDFIPPLSPLLTGYRVTLRGIEINWVSSPDEDVREHQVFRLERGVDSIPGLIARLPGSETVSLVDSLVRKGVRYTYSVRAVDSSGLISAPTPSLTAFTNRNGLADRCIERMDAVADRENRILKLIWKDELKNVREYELYKGQDGVPPVLWQKLPSWQREVTDKELYSGIKYVYLLRALFIGGGNSEIKTITVEL